jgi:NADH:ubiquinone oxidoreductase subunit K
MILFSISILLTLASLVTKQVQGFIFAFSLLPVAWVETAIGLSIIVGNYDLLSPIIEKKTGGKVPTTFDKII